ncbi:Uncharacterised protein [Yersinia pekkanenii]|uniref:Uncharacterized protein n=1 Tax=Yersinia pekkanenii TaxID=1288385 RepID=A0A0T9QI21_9GAMM|nr:Uncharacterised protein [Yersinia pekkanenii]
MNNHRHGAAGLIDQAKPIKIKVADFGTQGDGIDHRVIVDYADFIHRLAMNYLRGGRQCLSAVNGLCMIEARHIRQDKFIQYNKSASCGLLGFPLFESDGNDSL